MHEVILQKRNRVTNLIQKITLLTKIPSNPISNFKIPLKQVYKLILEFYEFKLYRSEHNEEEADLRVVDGLLDFFLKKFGIKQIAEKRFKEFLVSAYEFQNNHKIQLFMRFIGMINPPEYALSEEKLYLRAFEQLVRLFLTKLDQRQIEGLRCQNRFRARSAECTLHQG
jgi:hypothetical protein